MKTKMTKKTKIITTSVFALLSLTTIPTIIAACSSIKRNHSVSLLKVNNIQDMFLQKDNKNYFIFLIENVNEGEKTVLEQTLFDTSLGLTSDDKPKQILKQKPVSVVLKQEGDKNHLEVIIEIPPIKKQDESLSHRLYETLVVVANQSVKSFRLEIKVDDPSTLKQLP